MVEVDLEQVLGEAVAARQAGKAAGGAGVSNSVTVATVATSVPTDSIDSDVTKWPAVAQKPAIAKVNYSHDAMIDLLIANPAISQNQVAATFGYTASWVSQVMSSDAFQMRMAERREQIVDPTLRLTVKNNFDALVLRSLDVLRHKLNAAPDQIPDNLILRTLDIGGRLAGYGVKDPPTPAASQTDIHIHLEQLGGGLVSLLQRKKLEVKAINDQEDSLLLPSIDISEGDFTNASQKTQSA